MSHRIAKLPEHVNVDYLETNHDYWYVCCRLYTKEFPYAGYLRADGQWAISMAFGSDGISLKNFFKSREAALEMLSKFLPESFKNLPTEFKALGKTYPHYASYNGGGSLLSKHTTIGIIIEELSDPVLVQEVFSLIFTGCEVIIVLNGKIMGVHRYSLTHNLDESL